MQQHQKNGPVANWGTLFVDVLCGSPYQLYIPDGSSAILYKIALTSTIWNSIGASTSTIQIETGSCAGTTGESLTLTFQKKPYIVLIQGNGMHTTTVCIYGATTTRYGYVSYETDEWSTSIAALSWGAKSLTLSNGSYSPSEKFYTSLNYSGKTYAYIAITM